MVQALDTPPRPMVVLVHILVMVHRLQAAMAVVPQRMVLVVLIVDTVPAINQHDRCDGGMFLIVLTLYGAN